MISIHWCLDHQAVQYLMFHQRHALHWHKTGKFSFPLFQTSTTTNIIYLLWRESTNGLNIEPWKTQIKNSHLSWSDMYVRKLDQTLLVNFRLFAIHLFPFKFKRIGNATRLYAFQFQHFSFRKTFEYLAWKVHGMLYLVILSPLNKDK